MRAFILALLALGLASFVLAISSPVIAGVDLNAVVSTGQVEEANILRSPAQGADLSNYSSPPPDDDSIRFFSLTGWGPHGAHGPVGQLTDGQNRIGGGFNLGQFFLMHGMVMDSHHRSCILTPLVNQWQCDEGGIRKS